jgi:hypothetical protein
MQRALLSFFIVLTACSTTSRSKYKPYEDEQGYQVKGGKGDLKISTFIANAYTERKDAELFAKFRAIEDCKGSSFEFAHILEVQDKTVLKDVIRSSSAGFPSYYYGMSPFYSRYHSGFGLGFSTMSSNTWEETYSYPRFEVTYECTNATYEPELILREVPAKEMQLLVKDLKGGLQVEEIIEGSPNADAVEVGDVILKANNRRIEEKSVFIQMFRPKQKNIPVVIMREGERKQVTLKGKDVSPHITNSQQEIIQSACAKEDVEKSSSLCK